MKRLRFILLITFLSPAISYAEDLPDWFYKSIKVQTPNQLSYFIEMSEDCPFKSEELNKIVDGVLVRSRIKPLENDIFVNNRIYLNLRVSCLSLKSGNPVFSIRVNFARYQPYPAIIIDKEFGTTGFGPKDYIKQTFKESVENAVTAHIKANFNL